MADNSLTLLAAVPQMDRMLVGNEERGAIECTLSNIASHSLSTISGVASIDPGIIG